MPSRLPAVAFRDPAKAGRNLDALARHLGLVAADLFAHLNDSLSRSADADMALNNLERVFAQPAGRDRLSGLLGDDARALDGLARMVAASQFFADTFVLFPEALDTLRAPPRRNPSTDDLTVQLRALVDAAPDDAGTLRAFRKFRQLQMLRIGVNDILLDRPLEEVTRELSRLADATLKVALAVALKTAAKKYGQPTSPEGQPARLSALAFGKLGGDELNYSSDIDLMFVYDADGETAGKRLTPVTNAEFFTRTVTEVVRLLSSHTDRGFAYRVDLRLRPEGAHGPLARTLTSTLSYYDLRGRTWERQALIKLRPVAGDRALGKEAVAALLPFVYRKYFSFSEINEVKALKRQMEHRAVAAGVDDSDVKTGRGGIRDIEFAVQFLQLLNGGDLTAVRQRNTLLALEALEIAGCLTAQETYILADAYRFLRKTEHRLQLLFDRQTHRLPTDPDGLRTLALRMGYLPQGGGRKGEGGTDKNQDVPSEDSPFPLPPSALPPTPSPLGPQKRSPLDEAPPPADGLRALLIEPLDLFLTDYHEKTAVVRRILDHLLHQTFAATGDRAEPESDLVLDPDPAPAAVQAVLGRYGFRDVPAAFANLNRLAQESVRLLSDRRCRHFLASIAPQLLKAVAETADPDDALNNLERVTATLGAKAVLYELFSASPPSLRLYVDLCANSPYLSAILMKNAGMEDELLDSLVLDQPRTAPELKAELDELLRGASDPEPILRSFQDDQLLRVGVRDLLGKADIRETTAALSDVADAVLNAVFDLAEPAMRAKFGVPRVADPTPQPPPRSGEGEQTRNPPRGGEGGSRSEPGGVLEQECRYAVLGLGKLGGREISYHSDLDLILVYEADGHTAGGRPTTAIDYFTLLAQRAIRALSHPGPLGRLYDVDMRLRPTGKSGSLVLPLAEFERYFAAGGAQAWERLAVTRARVLRGEPAFAAAALDRIRAAVLGTAFDAKARGDALAMRDRLAALANARNLKRIPGGLVDVEFAVQMLQWKHGQATPAVLAPNVWAALDALQGAGLLTADEASAFRAGYSFLRTVEARLRIVTDRPLTEVPDTDSGVEKLARRLGLTAAAFRAELAKHLAANRAAFASVVVRLS